MGSAREDDGVDGSRKEGNSSLGLGHIASLLAWVFLRNAPDPEWDDRRADNRRDDHGAYHEDRPIVMLNANLESSRTSMLQRWPSCASWVHSASNTQFLILKANPVVKQFHPLYIVIM